MINDKVHIITTFKQQAQNPYHYSQTKMNSPIPSPLFVCSLDHRLSTTRIGLSVFLWLGNIQDDGRGYRL